MGKRTPFLEIHKHAGAKLVDFGGWEMPIQYTSIIDEHLTTRSHAGLFDISHMGEFEVTGKDTIEFVQRLITNDISKINIGQALYTPLCYENGTFVDDIIVYLLNSDKILLVVNASNSDKDFLWIDDICNKSKLNVELRNISDMTALLALQGPNAAKILEKVVEHDLGSINNFGSVFCNAGDVEVMVSKTGYTGESGFELFFNVKEAVILWEKLVTAGGPFGLKPVGLGARDTLRLEAGMRLYGNDIDDTVTPIEAGLSWAVNFDKECFVGKEALVKQSGNVKRRLIGFEMIDKSIARHGYPVCKGGINIGSVTSGTFSPSLKKPIGMAYVCNEYTEIGSEIEIEIRGKNHMAKVVSLPFVKR